MISLGCLIYRSTKYAEAVWESAHRYTPHLQDGRARFFFVANDATPEVLDFLQARRYPHVIQTNPRLSANDLRAQGYTPTQYLNQVYRGWNRVVWESEERMVLLQSDLMFSPDWLETLEQHDIGRYVVAPRLVERRHPIHGVFRGALQANFGDHPDRFREKDFVSFVARQRGLPGSTQPVGAYAPVYASRSAFMAAGLYPEGNLKRPDSDRVLRYGDRDLFLRLSQRGMRHITAMDSMVYHFKEGEMSE